MWCSQPFEALENSPGTKGAVTSQLKRQGYRDMALLIFPASSLITPCHKYIELLTGLPRTIISSPGWDTSYSSTCSALPALMSSNWLPLPCPLGVGELPLLHDPICHSVTPPTRPSSLCHSIHTSILYYNVLFLCMPFFLEGRFCSLSLGTLADSSLYSLCLVEHLTHESVQQMFHWLTRYT